MRRNTRWCFSMTKRYVPSGVMPALVTPFTKDGDIIENSFKDVIDYTIEKGATGIVPAGTTGEFIYMRTEERKKLLRLAVEFADGRVPVVAGTGQNSTRATVALTKYAADIGCDAALVITPFYLRPSDKGYYEHYESVATKGDLPVILYNIPQCTLGVLESNVVLDLAELDNIVGIKDSSGNIPYTMELIQKLSGKIPVLIGHDECVLSAISAGASAAILASANLIPHIWMEIIENVKSGNIKRAAELQHSVQTLSRIITRNGGAPPVKAGFRMMGIDAGKARLPLDTGGTLTVEMKEEVRLELENLKLIESLVHPKPTSASELPDLLTKVIGKIDPSSIKIGTGSNSAVSLVTAAGPKDGVIGEAFVRLLTTPKVGHEALTVILEPNLPVKPSSLMLPVQQIRSMRQASLFYGPIQSGAARAVANYLLEKRIPNDDLAKNVMIMLIDVDLNNSERRQLTRAAEDATRDALTNMWG